MKTKKITVILSILLLLIIACLVIIPEISIEASLNGLIVWATNILPALFPFFFFTKLIGELGFVTQISDVIAPFTKKLFNTNGISGYVYVISILSGYPVGAKLTSDLYEKKYIDRGQAHRIITFTSTSGPLFILGTVAIGMFNNKVLGYVVLLSHFIGSLTNGLLYRNYMYDKTKSSQQKLEINPSNNAIEECMLNSIKSILIVGGYICIFFMLITMINHFKLFALLTKLISSIFPTLNESALTSIFNGIIELTRGCLDLSSCGLSTKTNAIILSGLISFGGISINLQALTFLKKMDINIKFYFSQKITHSIFSMILAFCFGLILL